MSDDLVRVTVHCKFSASPVVGLYDDDERTVFVRKRKAKAFCEGCSEARRILGGRMVMYRDGSKYIGIMIDKPVDGWLCPHCGHAVTWYSTYEEARL